MKNPLLLFVFTCLLGVSSSYGQYKTANHNLDEVLTDYVKAIQTRDTALLADSFHSSVFPLFKTTRQAFANQIFTSMAQLGLEVQFERTPYKTATKDYSLNGVHYQSLSLMWQLRYRTKPGDTSGLEPLKKIAEFYRSTYKNVQELYQLTYAMPADVEMVSLNEQTGELRLLQPETNVFVYETSKQEWRLVPGSYSAFQLAKHTPVRQSKSAKKR